MKEIASTYADVGAVGREHGDLQAVDDGVKVLELLLDGGIIVELSGDAGVDLVLDIVVRER